MFEEVKFLSISHKITTGGYGAIYRGHFKNQSVVVKTVLVTDRDTHNEIMKEVKTWIAMSPTGFVPDLLFHSEINIKSTFEYTKIFVCENNNACDVLDYISNDKHWDIIRELNAKDSGIRSTYPVVFANGTYEYLLARNTKIELCISMAKALLALHEKGFVHRDVKCGNFVVMDTRAWLIDFGLSDTHEGASEENAVVGTPGYCDPHVEDFGWTSHTSDIYSLGVVFVRLWCGDIGDKFDLYKEYNQKGRTEARDELLYRMKTIEKNDPVIANMIRRMLSKTIPGRITLETVIHTLSKHKTKKRIKSIKSINSKHKRG